MSASSYPASASENEISEFHNLGSWPSHWAQLKPNQLAVGDADRRLDWSSFAGRVGRASGLLQREGIQSGDRVAFLLRNRTAALEILFGTARVGGICLPINLRLTAREIAFQLDDCRPAAIFFESDIQALVEETLSLASHTPLLRVAVGGIDDAYEAALDQASETESPVAVSPDAPAILMYTSGTTGAPKGALLPHRKALYNARNAIHGFQIRSDDRVLVAAPLFHSLGLQILSLPLLYAGGSLLLQDRFEPDAVWRAAEEEAISYFGGVPAMHQRLYQALNNGASAGRRFPALRFIFSAGSAISAELIRDFSALDILVLQGYGQTETSTLCCLDSDDALRKAGSVGRPVPHAEVRVVLRDTLGNDPRHWRDADPGDTGEIVVRGPINMLGYWERPAATAETLIGDWLRTGDLARRDAEGFVTLVGRAREMFISGGENVYPAEVEAAYREHPAIREIAVIGVPDPTWGEVGRAHVILEPGEPLDEASLAAWAHTRLAGFKLPREIVIETEFPRTASGKVRKHRLKGPA